MPLALHPSFGSLGFSWAVPILVGQESLLAGLIFLLAQEFHSPPVWLVRCDKPSVAFHGLRGAFGAAQGRVWLQGADNQV